MFITYHPNSPEKTTMEFKGATVTLLRASKGREDHYEVGAYDRIGNWCTWNAHVNELDGIDEMLEIMESRNNAV